MLRPYFMGQMRFCPFLRHLFLCGFREDLSCGSIALVMVSAALPADQLGITMMLAAPGQCAGCCQPLHQFQTPGRTVKTF